MTTRFPNPGVRHHPGAFFQSPSPTFRGRDLAGCGELFVKDDGVLRDDYGGNKVRKLEGILPRAAERGTTRVLTVGPAGSHHVLATTVLGAALGLTTAAVLFPQSDSAHARETLQAALASGLEPIAVRSRSGVAGALLRERRPGDLIVPPGASSPAGALGYAHAVAELEDQVERGEVPAPDLIVVAAGSGGTAAGLLAGLAASRLETRLLAVDVGAAGLLAAPLIIALAAEVLRRQGQARRLPRLTRLLQVERGYCGAGYGRPLESFSAMSELARSMGLALEGTYTAKALAAAFDHVRGLGRKAGDFAAERGSRLPLRVMYWHTLSKHLPRAPSPAPLPEVLDRLFVR
jgi:D-cysteine desulfhydrase